MLLSVRQAMTLMSPSVVNNRMVVLQRGLNIPIEFVVEGNRLMVAIL